MSALYICRECARYGGRMRGSALHRCFTDDTRTTYVPVRLTVCHDGQRAEDACRGYEGRDDVGA